MRLPGIGEIILIFIVAAIVILGIKIFGTPPARKTRRFTRYEDEEEEEYEEEEDTRIKGTRRFRAQIVGVIAIIIGVIVFASSLSLVKWVFWGPVGAIVILGIGVFTILLARRR